MKRAASLLPLYLFILLPFLASCEREPALFLCDHVTSAPARVAVDWSHFTRFETPTGMTVKLFERDDSGTYRLRQSTSTNDLTHVDYWLPAGHYADYVINQSEGEFGTVTFANTNDWQTASVNTVRDESKWYKDTIVSSPLVSDIEWVGTDRHDNLELTQEQLDTADGRRITIDTLRPRNIVRTVTVYVHIKNIASLRSARASLGGLAGTYLLGQGHTGADKVTQLLETWHETVDSVATDGSDMQWGTIVAQISSFGLPDGHTGQPGENTLHLECLLKNDSILRFDYPVGDRFHVEYDVNDRTNIDLHFVIDITMKEPLPDVPDDDRGGSAFEVTVEDWGDENSIHVSI